jgi:NADH dehydrogenase/NADH:ubiquinone oxidoreductase subunit G
MRPDKKAETVKLTIDGARVKAVRGDTVLEAAREAGIEIPTLCHHAALIPTGSCRLCVVEVAQGGRKKTMASCVTPVAEGMKVATDTPELKRIRRTVVALLAARCPDLPVIKKLARDFGIRKNPFHRDDEDCFLCGMCVRACREIVGVGAIGIANRGPESEVVAPFSVESSVCIGCGTCAAICPARTFTLDKVFRRRSMHTTGGADSLFRCKVCESHYTGR